jgi:hypothetical protein
MPSYQGRALMTAPEKNQHGGRLRRILQMLGLIAVVAGLAHVPWQELRRRFAVVDAIDVDGVHYLDAARVIAVAGVKPGADLLTVNRDRIRQRLLADSRIREARVERHGLRGLAIHVEERLPVLVVRHGVPWEMDAAGVLLAPLKDGVVADVPLLSGVDFESLPAGAVVSTPPVSRALAWAKSISARGGEGARPGSEIEVGDERSTGLLLMNGTRVRAPAFPPGLRRLSALRVVLADLRARGVVADEVDLRFDQQVIVRPVGGGTMAATPAVAPGTS